jgi:hypothetical protein
VIDGLGDLGQDAKVFSFCWLRLRGGALCEQRDGRDDKCNVRFHAAPPLSS